jgi:hypothetical protein
MLQRVLLSVFLLSGYPVFAAEEAADIGGRRELLVDDYLVESLSGCAAFRMHHPQPREIVLVHDAPWEGSGTGYHTVFRHDRLYHMYYKAWHLAPEEGKMRMPHDTIAAYARSADGIHWVKPELGIFEYEGTRRNNIIWMGKGAHDFTPFYDTRPGCPAAEQFKAVGYGPDPKGAYAFKSADGIHWSFLQQDPILTEGAFDSQNLAFWDSVRGEYRVYFRAFDKGVRVIRAAVSKDFRNWSKAEALVYPGAPAEALYTNQIKPYYRAPHLFIGFPARYVERNWTPAVEALPEPGLRKLRASSNTRYGSAVTDALFMTSRDGTTFQRWGEAFLRPGLRNRHNWSYGDNYIAWHVVETESAMDGAPRELSLYATESYFTGDSSYLRRFTLRIDGFVSINAPLKGGEILTRPLLFKGAKLVLNFSASAAGGIRVEVQDTAGKALPGYGLDDCIELLGDDLARTVTWQDGEGLAPLAGVPVRIRFVMKDADLYSFQFQESRSFP